MKRRIAFVVITTIIALTIGITATDTLQTVSAIIANHINIQIDGEAYDGESQPILLHEDTPYLPIDNLDLWKNKDIKWNADSSTLELTTPKNTSGTNVSEFVEAYKSTCQKLTYSTYDTVKLDVLKGNNYVITGEVIVFANDWNGRTIIMLDVSQNQRNSQYVYCELPGDLANDKFSEGDKIAIWGVINEEFRISGDGGALQFYEPLLSIKHYEIFEDEIPTDIYDNNDEDEPESTEKIYGPNEKWVVDGEWELTIHSAKTHTKCNRFDDAEDYKQVVIVTYTYKNLGYDRYSNSELRFDWTNMNIYDCNSDIGIGYPCTHCKDPQYINKGKQCSNAQEAYVLVTPSKEITLEINMEPNFGEDPYTATFVIPVK